MTRKKQLLLLLGFLALLQMSATARAREDWVLLTYDVSFPVGDTGDFIDAVGWRGFGLEGRSFITDQINGGFVLGWHNLYQKSEDKTAQIDNVTISGTQARFIDFVPILAGVNYHFFDRSYRIRPYVGVKGGLYWIKQRVEVGFIDVIVNRNWHVGLAPEAGFTFLTGELDIYGFVNGDFTYILGRDESIDYTYVGMSLGFVYVF